jgi:hypothetical protein
MRLDNQKFSTYAGVFIEAGREWPFNDTNMRQQDMRHNVGVGQLLHWVCPVGMIDASPVALNCVFQLHL